MCVFVCVYWVRQGIVERHPNYINYVDRVDPRALLAHDDDDDDDEFSPNVYLVSHVEGFGAGYFITNIYLGIMCDVDDVCVCSNKR